MKKYFIYITILVAGLLLGKLFFNDSVTKEAEHDHGQTAESAQMWTCSMHPQIMRNEPGDCPICGMDLIPVETGSGGLMANQFKLSKNAMALANIQTTVVGIGATENGDKVLLSGKISENLDETATQPAHFNGRIEKLYVNSLGEPVKKGKVVAEVYSPELVAAQQELLTAYKNKNAQPKLYEAVRNKFRNWMIHDSQLDEVENTGKIKTRFTIYASVSGVVTEIMVNEGAHIMDGMSIFKVANLNTVWAEFDVYESNLSAFKTGQNIVITTKANSKQYQAKVSFIDPVLNTNTRTVRLRAVLNNNTGELKPGMFVEGTIVVNEASNQDIVSIPESAVLWTGERSIVYVKINADEPIFEMREVTLGNTIGKEVMVLEGLANGEEIVTNGTFTVDAAAQLQGKPSMMNKEGGVVMTGHEGHLGMEMTQSNTNQDVSDTDKRMEVSSEFKGQLRNVFDTYLNTKDGLVKDDFKTAKESVKNLLSVLVRVDMKLLSNEEAHQQWMPLAQQIKSSAQAVFNAKTIEEERANFKQLSLYVSKAVQIFGVNKKVYKQFCPMADDNKGAYWLSVDKEILNPYFGKAMLTCGSVEQVID